MLVWELFYKGDGLREHSTAHGRTVTGSVAGAQLGSAEPRS